MELQSLWTFLLGSICMWFASIIFNFVLLIASKLIVHDSHIYVVQITVVFTFNHMTSFFTGFRQQVNNLKQHFMSLSIVPTQTLWFNKACPSHQHGIWVHVRQVPETETTLLRLWMMLSTISIPLPLDNAVLVPGSAPMLMSSNASV